MLKIVPDRWNIRSKQSPVGSQIKCVVKNSTDFGVFLSVPEGVDGLVHVSDISWENKNVDPNTMFKKGDEIECVVLSIDKSAEKFSLGIKQLSDDPWRSVADKYPPGSRVKGKVTKVADFGIFLEIETGVEGLLHVSELEGEGKPKDKLKAVAEGTEIDCLVTSVDMKEHKLSLSMKALSKAEEKENIRQYTKS